MEAGLAGLIQGKELLQQAIGGIEQVWG